MRSALLATFAAIAFSSSSFAADMPSRTAPEPYPRIEPTANWTGAYVGISGGWGGGLHRYFSTYTGSMITTNSSQHSSGALLGGQAGFNFQFADHLVAGVEADYHWSTIDDGVSYIPSASSGLSRAKSGSRLLDMGTARVRLGAILNESTLAYATGGLAYADVKAYDHDLSVPAPQQANQVKYRSGWTVGGGVEYMLTQNLTLKAEYLHVDLDKMNFVNPVAGAVTKISTSEEIIRAGVNYRFGAVDAFSAPLALAY